MIAPVPPAFAREVGEGLAGEAGALICVFGPDGSVWFVSGGAAEALGVEGGNRTPRRWSDLFPPPSAARPLADALGEATAHRSAATGSLATSSAAGARWFDFVLIPQFGHRGEVDFIVGRFKEAAFAVVLARCLRECAGESGTGGRSPLPPLIPPLLEAGITLSPATERWLAALRPETARLVGEFEPLRLALVQLALCAQTAADVRAQLAITPRDAGCDARYLSLEFQGYRNLREFRVTGWEEIRALIEDYGGTALLIQPPGGEAIVELILRFEDLEA